MKFIGISKENLSSELNKILKAKCSVEYACKITALNEALALSFLYYCILVYLQ